MKNLYKENSNIDAGNNRLVSIFLFLSRSLEKAEYTQLKMFWLTTICFMDYSLALDSLSTDSCLVY